MPPADTERCQDCVLPKSLPSALLDDQATCALCQRYGARKRQVINKSRKKKEFERLIERARSLKRPYDCLIPLSGGKDSTYALYLCDKVYKLRCLCVTFDNGYLSDGALANIRKAIEATRADHIMYQVNRSVMLDLYKLFLEKTGTFCPPCLRGIGLAADIAERFRIPLTVAGTGWQVSYLAGIPELYQEGTVPYFKNVVKGEPIERDVRPMMRTAPTLSVSRILKVASRLLRMPRLSSQHYLRLYDYMDPDYEEIYDVLRKEMGWSTGADTKTEHLDCMIHDVAGHIHHLKFPELNPHTIHRAGLVRMGKLGRDEALAQETRERAEDVAPDMLSPFCEEIGISPENFREHVGDWRRISRFRKGKKGVLKSLYHRLTGQ